EEGADRGALPHEDRLGLAAAAAAGTALDGSRVVPRPLAISGAGGDVARSGRIVGIREAVLAARAPTHLASPRKAAAVATANDRGVEIRGRHVPHQLLEPVEAPRVRREHVQDDVEVVGHDPLALARAVDALWQEPLLLLQARVHLVPDRRGLAWGATCGDHEV